MDQKSEFGAEDILGESCAVSHSMWDAECLLPFMKPDGEETSKDSLIYDSFIEVFCDLAPTGIFRGQNSASCCDGDRANRRSNVGIHLYFYSLLGQGMVKC